MAKHLNIFYEEIGPCLVVKEVKAGVFNTIKAFTGSDAERLYELLTHKEEKDE
jgi:hypothetical protein